jgi:hypothetical protein
MVIVTQITLVFRIRMPLLETGNEPESLVGGSYSDTLIQPTDVEALLRYREPAAT